jgi:NAD(P)-dependent dehydrogenase (short-subunit alcohol dehydrogenase family)
MYFYFKEGKGKINWEGLQSDKDYSKLSAYFQAKLANVLFTRELADRYGKDGITSVSLHPGGVRTEIWRELKGNKNAVSILFTIFYPVFYLLTKDSKEGAQTTIHCAVDEKIPQQNGEYFEYFF